tara:strand:+ start:1454 stop:3139 length:1686 start_codon:yes stop_codon:yes gene_type:complete
MYKIYITKSDYSEWYWYNDSNLLLVNEKDISVNPLEHKLFNNDVIDETKNLVFSQIRTDKYIAGILLLSGKTYGRSKNGKLKYKCVPNDPKLPKFLIPYEIKSTGFNKNILNKFVIFKFKDWEDKHPNGELLNALGEINDLNAFYEYQLYCKNLCISIKEFTNEVTKKMKNKNLKENINTIISSNKNIEKRFDYFVFSIDARSTTDIDDAMSIKDNKISVYISNVPILMEFYQLWNSFSERISTIYLPDRKRPMLPTLLSENLCSLLENESRIVFCMDIYLNETHDDIENILFTNAFVKINKNYRYEDEDYLLNENYIQIKNICSQLCKKYKYIKEVKDSHDLIAFLMIMMNLESAKQMIKFKDGIYRTLKIKDNENLDKKDIPDDIYNFIKIWQSSSGIYTNYEERVSHDLMASSIEDYLHITSPIRRLVDLLNMMKLQVYLGLNDQSVDADNFYKIWIKKLDYINTTMRAIRKVQNDCSILAECTNNPQVLKEEYYGYIFDKIDWTNQFKQYTVYIPKIKVLIRINVKNELENYTKHKFKLYLFEDAVTLKRKIRGELI